MKLQVVHPDGHVETLNIIPPIICEGNNQFQNCLHAADGMDYYFTLDGSYDGWGCGCPPGATAEDAQRLIRTIQATREEP